VAGKLCRFPPFFPFNRRLVPEKGDGGSNPSLSDTQSCFFSVTFPFYLKTRICLPKCANVRWTSSVNVFRAEILGEKWHLLFLRDCKAFFLKRGRLT